MEAHPGRFPGTQGPAGAGLVQAKSPTMIPFGVSRDEIEAGGYLYQGGQDAIVEVDKMTGESEGVVLVLDLAEKLGLDGAYVHSAIRKRHIEVRRVFNPAQPGRRVSAISVSDARVIYQEFTEARKVKIVPADALTEGS